MRIGIDYRPALDGRGGIAVYVRELVAALAAHCPKDEMALFGHRLRRPVPGTTVGVPGRATLHRRRIPAPVLALAGHVGLGADLLVGGADVVHATDYVFLDPGRAPLVATIHDVCFETLPDCYTSAQRKQLAAATRRLVARAARIVVPVARVATELVEHFPAAAGKVDVVAHGPRALPDAPPVRHGTCHVLFVGTLQPRKNLLRVLEASDHLVARHPGARLVVAGGRGWRDKDLVEGIRSRAHVIWEDHVGPERLSALLRGARALAAPALGEGFGLAVLEAMAQGVAVVVGAETAAADVAQDGGLAVDAYDVDALAEALLRLVEDDALHARIAAAGRARAATYSWRRAAEETRAVYQRAVDA